MSKIGSLKITIEFVFFMFIIQFSGYDLETCWKLCIFFNAIINWKISRKSFINV